MLFTEQASSLKIKRVSQAAGFTAVTIAAAALIGEWVGLPLLSNWGSSFGILKPVTAMCLAALGLSLVHPRKDSRVTLPVGLAVTTLAVLELFGVDLGINHWLVPQAAMSGPEAN